MKATRFLLFLLACVLSIATGWAKQATYYYSYTAKTSTGNTTYGSVYASTEDTTPGSTAYKASVSSGTKSVGAYGTPNIDVYLWAKPASGYTLEKWVDNSGNAITGQDDDNDGIFTATGSFNVTSTTERTPTSATFTATFKKLGVLRVFSDEGGAAYVSKIDNDVNESVTLTAYNLYDHVFKGWEHNGAIVSTSKSLTVTVPNLSDGQHDDWTAKWEKQSVTYYRLRSNKGYYLSIVGKMGSVLKHTSDGAEYFDGFKLHGTIKLVSAANAKTDPGTILKISHSDYASGLYSNFDIQAQGIKLTDVIQASINKVKEDNSDFSMPKTFTLSWDGKDGYKIKNSQEGYFIQGVGNDGNGYFASETYSNAQKDTWYFEPVDGSSNTANLSVTAEKTIGDMHYATLFVDFPFQCGGDMKAYYVTDIVDEIAECNTNGITNVHAFTPVILAWTGSNGYVTPINTEKDQPGNVESKAIDEGWWKGCINLYTTIGGDTPNLQTCYFDRNGNMTDSGSLLQFDTNTMRVMNINGDDLVFDKNYSGNMPSNKCYIVKDPIQDLYVVIFPLELNEADLALDDVRDAIYSEVHVIRSVAGPKGDEEWGNWNTLCLPFDLDADEIANLFGECELKALSNFWVTDDGILHLRFSDADEIACGQPYMIRVKANVPDLTLHNKRVSIEKNNYQRMMNDDYTLDFQGSYTWLDGTNGNYVPQKSFIISSNKFYYVDSNVKMKGFRAYFLPKTNNPAKSPVKAMKIAEDEPATAISQISFEGLEDGIIYNTQGIRQNSLKRGINIVNGKKIIR